MTFSSRQATAFCLRLILIGPMGFCAHSLVGAERPDIAAQLSAGQLAEAEQSLDEHLAGNAGDDMARFQLGTVRVVRAVEQLAQDCARYGALSRALGLPFIRVGGFATADGEPEQISYNDLRVMIQKFQFGVSRAQETLAPIKDDKLAWNLDLHLVRVDLDGDGTAGKQETLAMLFRFVNRRFAPPAPENLLVGFDSADVLWLRGYCHLLAAMADMILAYDHERLFEITAHVFFAKPETEFAARRTAAGGGRPNDPDLWEDIPDIIAAIHLMDFKLREPKRLISAQQHLFEMIKMSRKSWDLIEAESDNEREWIPGPNQQSVIEGLAMNQDRIRTWRRFLTEAEDVLKGEKLVPFWRKDFKKGVNLGKVFTEPRDFDLVLWVQGTAAMPYLEDGPMTSPETWTEFQRVFRGEFVGFAAWIN